jgi:hypothetical protein
VRLHTLWSLLNRAGSVERHHRQTGTFTNTQMNEYVQSLVNGASPLAEFSAVQGSNRSTDALTGAIQVPSTATVWNGNAVAGYANNSSTTSHVTGGYFSGRCLANSTQCWGVNGVAIDATGLTSGIVLTHEFDTQPQNLPSAYTSGGVQSNLFAPQAGTFPLNAYSANIGQSGKWSVGFFCNQGSVGNACMDTGAAGTATSSSGNFNSNSVIVTSTYWTGSGTGIDHFQFVTGIGTGSPPTFVDLNLTHPSGIGSANFLINNSVNFGLVNSSGNASMIVPNASAPSNSIFTLPAAGDTLVGRTSTDTLTNKTLTSPALTTPTLGGGSTLNLYKRATDSPGSITVNAQTCTDRGVAVSGLATSAVMIPTANYALEANLSLSPGQAVSGTAHYRICNVTGANISLNPSSAFNLAILQ